LFNLLKNISTLHAKFIDHLIFDLYVIQAYNFTRDQYWYCTWILENFNGCY